MGPVCTLFNSNHSYCVREYLTLGFLFVCLGLGGGFFRGVVVCVYAFLRQDITQAGLDLFRKPRMTLNF